MYHYIYNYDPLTSPSAHYLQEYNLHTRPPIPLIDDYRLLKHGITVSFLFSYLKSILRLKHQML